MVSYPRRIQLTERGAKMSRLTDRNYKNTTLALDSCKPYLKLGELEDLEEQIGCPLEVFVKLHQQMKFYRLNALNEIIECEIDNPNDDEVYHIQADGIIFNQYDYGWQFYSFKDYKKTWWLKEDKSE